MISTLRTIYQCPYCPLGRGEIAIDVAVAMSWHAVRADSSQVRIDQNEVPFVAFDPDALSRGPCVHLISFYIDIQFELEMADGDRRRGNISVDWDHPWFSRHDPDQRLQTFLWENIPCEPESQFAAVLPRVPHQVIRVDEGIEDIDPISWEVLIGRVLGWFIAANEPQAFLTQLPACEQRLQELWARERAGG